MSGLLYLGARPGDSEDVFAKARGEISPQKDFRIALRSVTLTRDEDTGRTTCAIWLGATWDRRLPPMLLQQGAVSVAYAKDANGKALVTDMSAQGPSAVTGRRSADVKIRVKAPARTCPQIDLLKGELTVTTPSKMLDFTFDSLKSQKKKLEGVTITLDKISAGPDRLSVELTIENPKGTPAFETFQTNVWLENNTIQLVRQQESAKQILAPGEHDEELLEPLTPLRARIRYHFKHQGKEALGKLEDWRLTYRTPGPIVEVKVPFELRNIPLP